MVKDVGILVIADNIPEEIRSRFRNCVEASKPKVSYEILMMGRYKRPKGEKFQKCKLLNDGLRKLINGGYSVIIQTDIDLIVPPHLIDKTYQLAKQGNICVHHCMRGLDPKELEKYESYDKYPWKKWLKSCKSIYASGCWNGMQATVWKKSGGFNEWMVNWGREDAIFRLQAIKRGIKWKDIYKFPLMHVNHSRRTKIDSAYNNRMNKKAKEQGKSNWL